MLAIGATGILVLAGLSLLTSLWEEFCRWRSDRRFQCLAREGHLPFRRPLAVDPAASSLPPITVEDAVAAYHALYRPLWAGGPDDDPKVIVEPLTPDVLRSLLGSPGDGTVARFDAEGGFSEK